MLMIMIIQFGVLSRRIREREREKEIIAVVVDVWCSALCTKSVSQLACLSSTTQASKMAAREEEVVGKKKRD